MKVIEHDHAELLREREAILKLCREACHSGVNAERHRMAHEVLVLMGDRPERTER